MEIDIEKAKKKWWPIIANLGVTEDNTSKWEIMARYAEYHMINESVAYATLDGGPGPSGTGGPYQGMSLIKPPYLLSQYETNPFMDYPSKNLEISKCRMSELERKYTGIGPWLGSLGSGEWAQNLLPISMKVLSKINDKHVILTDSPRINLIHPVTSESSTIHVSDIEIEKIYTLAEIEEIEEIERERDPVYPKLFDQLEELKLVDELIKNINESESNVVLIYLLVQSINIFPDVESRIGDRIIPPKNPGSYKFILRSRYSDWYDPDYKINFTNDYQKITI